ncbi:MAG: alpha/beta hydrolase [Clostridia bacterium]
MASLRGKIFSIILRYRHLLKGQLKSQVIDRNTSIQKLRDDVEKSAAKMAKIPIGVEIQPADFPNFYAEWLIPRECKKEQVILYFHGGGFVMGTSKDHRGLVAKFVEKCGVQALTFDYSLAPEHPFPAAINDGVAIYEWLLSSGYQGQNIIIAGDSAGGGIALSTILVLKDKKLALPAAIVVFSPCTDLTCSGESHKTKAKLDPATPQGATETYTSYYIGESDPSDPYMSPLFGNLVGLPPLMIQVGENETLLDDAVRLAKNAENAGVEVQLHLWEGMFHCFPLMAPMFPEATQAMNEVCQFIQKKLEEK